MDVNKDNKNKIFFSKTLNGLKWSYIFTGVNVITQLTLTTILARLLSPNDYGLIAMGNVVLRFGSYFAQMGIGQALIQKQSTDKKEVFTAYLISFFISCFIYILIYIAAPLSIFLFPNLEVVKIIRVLGINFIFSSISMVSISLLRMQFKFLLLGSIDFASYIIGNAAVSIIFASLGFGVWSLVFATLLQSFLLFVLSFYFSRGLFQLQRINYNSAKALLSYGSKYTVSTFVEVLTYSADATIVGHYFTAKAMGIYNRATLLVQLPSQHISANLIKVFFPTLNEIKHDKEKFIKYYQGVSLLLGMVLFGVCVFISINAQEIVTVILGKKWQETIPILRICALAVPFNLLINYQGLVYDVYGFLKKKILIKLLHLVFMVNMLFLGSVYFGLSGLVFAFTITEFLLYFLYVFIGIKMLKESLGSVIKLHVTYLYIILLVAITSTSINLIYHKLNLSTSIGFVLEIVIVPLACLFMVLLYPPASVKNLLKVVISNGSFQNYFTSGDSFVKVYLKKIAGTMIK